MLYIDTYEVYSILKKRHCLVYVPEIFSGLNPLLPSNRRTLHPRWHVRTLLFGCLQKQAWSSGRWVGWWANLFCFGQKWILHHLSASCILSSNDLGGEWKAWKMGSYPWMKFHWFLTFFDVFQNTGLHGNVMPQTEWAQSFKEWASAWSALIYSDGQQSWCLMPTPMKGYIKAWYGGNGTSLMFLFGAKVLFDESNS